MLYAFGFEQVAVMVSDLYFVDPDPGEAQEGAERGVRVELRILERGPLKGSIYSAQPITVDRPIWRVDLLESVAGEPGSFDRTHHHPAFTGWEPSRRHYVRELSAEPLEWLGTRLSDLDTVAADAGLAPGEIGAADGSALRRAVPRSSTPCAGCWHRSGPRPRRRRPPNSCSSEPGSAGSDAPPGRPGRRVLSPMTLPTLPSMAGPSLFSDRAADIYGQLLKERIVFLGTQVDDTSANLMCAQLAPARRRGRRRGTSTSTSTRPADRSTPDWPSTTPCNWCHVTSRPPAWAWPPRWASFCSAPARRASASPCPTPGS